MFIDKIKFSTHYCSLNGADPVVMKERRLNIFVKITDSCNANCPFCIYANNDKNFKFNFIKFADIIKKLIDNNVHINRISFTGGEPTTKLDDLIKCLDLLDICLPYTFIVVNSNGFKIKEVINHRNLHNVSLSRHEISDNQHCNIMKTTTIPTKDDLQQLALSNKIHLTCNLIRGNIDSFSKAIAYLEFSNSIGIYDVGFVSLMKVNRFCYDNFIDFDNLIIDEEVTPCNRIWNCTDTCKCKNYLYLPKVGRKPIKFYSRFRIKPDIDSGGTIIYDGHHFRPTFGSDQIII